MKIITNQRLTKLFTHENKLEQRLVNEAQTATTAFIQSMDLRQAIRSARLIQEKFLREYPIPTPLNCWVSRL